MSYNSCQLNQAQKAVLKYAPKHNHILTKEQISLLQNQIDTIVYLTLKDNQGYWFLIKDCNKIQLSGFAQLNNHWVYEVIKLSDVLAFC